MNMIDYAIHSIRFLEKYLNINTLKICEKTIHEGVIALWGCAHLDPLCNIISRETISNALDVIIEHNSIFGHVCWGERFHNRLTNENDYYSANITLIIIETISIYCNNSTFKSCYIEFLSPHAFVAATGFDSSGAFRSPQNPTKVHFWEHFQAIRALLSFYRLVNFSSLEIGRYMYIKPTHFHQTSFISQEDLIVVLMPFSTQWSDDVFNTFKDVVLEKKLQIWKSDLEFNDDNIMQTVWSYINRASIVIADCTGRNPNVFYELGIAHTLGKSVFICAQNKDDIPFDIGSIRHYIYGTLPSELGKLKVNLKKFLEQRFNNCYE